MKRIFCVKYVKKIIELKLEFIVLKQVDIEVLFVRTTKHHAGFFFVMVEVMTSI